jgi:hypothetical protein
LSNSNGPISGSFNASKRLELTTSNAPIRANIGLKNDDDPDHTVKLCIKTNNSCDTLPYFLRSAADISCSPIDARISLLSDNKFKVVTTTSNGHVRVKFPHSTVDSVLHLFAATSNFPAAVGLNPAFEGTFKLRTNIFRPSVNVSEVEDPAGEDRERIVEKESGPRGAVEGTVQWVPDDDEKEQGSVVVKTSNSLLHLRL